MSRTTSQTSQTLQEKEREMSDTSMTSTVTEKERFDRSVEFEHQCFDEKKTQTEMTLEYLKRFGSITPLEALSAFGCFRLSARISDLRADGYEISTELNKGKKNFAIYRLEKTDDEIQADD